MSTKCRVSRGRGLDVFRLFHRWGPATGGRRKKLLRAVRYGIDPLRLLSQPRCVTLETEQF